MGGDDQWSNILAGADLIRRKEQKAAFGLTCSLLLKSDGKKMGKTEGGALWLDPEKTSPYEFYQYWVNVADSDVRNCLALLTFLPMEEVERLGALEGSEINEAKKILAYEVTKQVHGKEEADKAAEATAALFGGGTDKTAMPTTELTKEEFSENGFILELMVTCGLCKSKGEGRKLIAGGGVSVNGQKVTDVFMPITEDMFEEDGLIIKKGKKVFHRVILK